ncbi:reverse transcriptase domain-containing protein [Tanacetum coccineum]
MPLRLQHILTLTLELGPGITPGARLTRLSFLSTGDPIRLDFKTKDIETQEHSIAKGRDVVDEDIRKPFKEARRTPFTRRIIEFAGPEYKMPTNIKLYDGTTDPEDHLSHFTGTANSGEWPMLVWCRIYSVRRACFKDPHEITKIVRRANESLTTFKERWTVETGFVMGVPEVMKISSFMDSVKTPELAKRFSDKVPVTVNEMMGRLDDFVRSKTAYANTELPKGETRETHRKHPKEILATETQLRLPVPRPMLNPLRSGNTDRYCDYHQEKGHYTNDCIQLRKQLEMALESGKLNHLVKDVRQRGRGSHGRDDPQPAKIINVISVNSIKDKKRKVREATESWMNIPISFPAISSEDISEEPLIVEAEVEGYLVRRVYVDEGSSVEVMFEHCFENLNPKIKARLRETQTDLVGFAGEVSKPLGKIEPEVCFGNGGLCRRTSMKFIMVRAPLPYNVILGRLGLKTLRAIPSTIHSMMKFPTPKGIATLMTRTDIIAECRRLEKKQMIEENLEGKGEVAVTEEVLVNPSFPDQLVTIGGGLSETCRDQLKCLLKDNMSVFAWELSDMTEEVAEWVKLGIVRPVKYPTYISNPVLVKKGDGTWGICIDFKNLNSACPKDYYPLPNIDCKVESVMGFKYKCFLDAYKSYHQIQMAEEDEEKTAFYTDQGTYCYTKMPFELKNAGATYQRLVDSTFQPQIGRNLEAYVDDMVVKSRDDKMLLADIAETFYNLKKINMKLNPKKYSFGVEEGKFLGYMVTSEGITANPRKMKALADLQSLRTLKEMQSLSGKLAALNNFLAKTLNEAKRNYAPMEKLALSLIHMTKRLRRYFEAHPVKVITDQLIKNILNNTETSKKLAKYDVELGAYNITFIPRNAVKGQVLADFLSEAPEGEREDLYFRMPEAPPEEDDTESWTLFTDGASSPKGSGAGLVLIGPSGIEYTYALRLTFPSTNNEAEYEALLAGLRIARQMNISNIEVKVDSKLVASQINGSYEANKDSMIRYLAKAKEYASGFKSFSIENIPRNMNQKADVLSKLALVAFNHLTKEVLVEVLNERSTEGQEVQSIVEEEGDNWMTPIKQCLEEGIWPKDKNVARCLRAKIGQYTMESGVLFKKGYLIPMLRCVGPLQANYVIREIHMGSCGMHVGPRAVVRKATRQGYYWPTMHEDAKKKVEKCDSCQIHAPVPRLSKTLMTSIMAPRPFYQWGMDILGPLPQAKGGAIFVIVAIDYFTKWIEVKPQVKITGKEVIRFVMENIICRFGLPRIIVTDNEAQLVNDPFKSWCGRFEIHQMNTAVAHPQANGLVERANRSLMEGIKTRLRRAKAGWIDELPNVLWAHRTSIKQSNGEIPFSLTYGSEAIILAEIGIPTYRTLVIREEYNEEEMRLNLDLLQERREAAAIREVRYKTKMEQYYNKKVRPAGFRPGEFILRRNEASRVEDQGKLGPKWEGPYRVMEAYENGSYKLQTLEDKEVPRTWHAINLRKCYM